MYCTQTIYIQIQPLSFHVKPAFLYQWDLQIMEVPWVGLTATLYLPVTSTPHFVRQADTY